MSIIDRIMNFFDLSSGEPLPQLTAIEGISPLQFNATGDLDDPYLYEDERRQRYAEYDAMDASYGDISCLAGDSKIFTLNGGWKTIKELSENGKSFYTLSYDPSDGSIVPSEAIAFITAEEGHERQMVEVFLDNGHSIKCTEDHRFLLRNEEWKNAGELKFGDSLMPGDVRLYTLVKSSNYFQIRQPNNGSRFVDKHVSGVDKRWVWLHRLVAKFVYGEYDRKLLSVHHVDNDQLNNEPNNLQLVTLQEHANIHLSDGNVGKSVWSENFRELHVERMKNNEYYKNRETTTELKNKIKSGISKNKRNKYPWKQVNIDLVNNILRCYNETNSINLTSKKLSVGWWVVKRVLADNNIQSLSISESNKKLKTGNSYGSNHRVLKVVSLTTNEAIYDLNVPVYHNFICNGTIVHNCALDIYSEESTQENNEIEKSVWVTSSSPEVQKTLEYFLESIEIEDKLFGMARHLGKYGDLFVFPTVGDEDGEIKGIEDLIFFHPSAVELAIDPRTGKLIGYNCDVLQFEGAASPNNPDNTIQKILPDNMKAKTEEGFSPWDFVHFRLSGQNLVSEYGSSMVEAARKTWQTLAMLETAIALHRLLRSGVKFAYYIDVGKNTTPDQSLAIINKYIAAVKKEQILQFTDPSVNRNNSNPGNLQQFLQRFKAYSMYDDIFWPIKEGSQSKIETFNVSGDIFAIEDVKHYQNKLRTSLGIPKAYLDQEIGGWNANKGLAQQDVRFAKKTERLQKSLIKGITELCSLHLLYKDFSKFDFTVHMEPPSALLTLQRLEVAEQKQSIATNMMGIADTFGLNKETWSNYVLREFLGMPEAKIEFFKIGANPPSPIQTSPISGVIPTGDGDQDLNMEFGEEESPLGVDGLGVTD